MFRYLVLVLVLSACGQFDEVPAFQSDMIVSSIPSNCHNLTLSAADLGGDARFAPSVPAIIIRTGRVTWTPSPSSRSAIVILALDPRAASSTAEVSAVEFLLDKSMSAGKKARSSNSWSLVADEVKTFTLPFSTTGYKSYTVSYDRPDPLFVLGAYSCE